METLFEELKRYVQFDADDEAALGALHPILKPELVRIADVFYTRILSHEGARTALEGGESQVGRLKITLVAWMDRLLLGPWDEEYFELRCRIGRVHVRIALPQHYMFGAMNVLRNEMGIVLERAFADHPAELSRTRRALDRILDLELAIMLHTYREDLMAQQSRIERLSTFGQLVGSIGHELRNPLGVMESSLYLIKGRVGSDERILKHIGRISEQIGIANSIISGLLDLIRDKPLARERVSLRTILDGAVGTLAVPPEVTLTTLGVEGLPEISGDPTQLRQVLHNLLENALHAVGSAGEITLRATAIQGKIEIVVSDSGPGVDPAIRKRLFEPLISAKPSGIGLGLALVKRFVERHGGTIAYAPQAGHLGARFLIQLPIEGPS
jgi:two-component system sensor histidine kinase HydH